MFMERKSAKDLTNFERYAILRQTNGYVHGCVVLKKVKSPETRLFQGFFEDFEGKIFGLVNAVSRTQLHRFFG